MPELQVAWQMCADVKPSCCWSSYHSALLFYMGAVGGLNIHTLFDHLFFSFFFFKFNQMKLMSRYKIRVQLLVACSLCSVRTLRGKKYANENCPLELGISTKHNNVSNCVKHQF